MVTFFKGISAQICQYLSRNSFFLRHFQGPIFIKKKKEMLYVTLVDADFIYMYVYVYIYTYICIGVLSWTQTHNSKKFRNTLPPVLWPSRFFTTKVLAPVLFLKQ